MSSSDDELMEMWHSRIGTKAIPTLNDLPFCQLITEDAIRSFCLAVGDLNPLWIDEEYGARSSFGRNAAPPHMLFALAPWSMHASVLSGFRSDAGDELPRPGGGGVQGGITITWERRLRLGDRITCDARLADVRTHRSRTWGRTFELIAEFTFSDQQLDRVASARFSFLGTERPDARSRSDLLPRTWNAEEIEEVRQLYAAQPGKIRGARPLYWDDVAVGEELPLIVKGPYTENSYIAFCAAVPLRSVVSTDEVFWNHSYERKVKGWPNRGSLGSIELTRQGVPSGHRYHFDYDSALKKGVAAPIDVGHQRICWLAQLVTMWMGDDGFLRSLEARHTGMNIMGDLTTCRGVVRGKEVVDGQHLVRCEIWCENHRGRNTEGSAVVALPARPTSGLGNRAAR